MVRWMVPLGAFGFLLAFTFQVDSAEGDFMRGDVDEDGDILITDAVRLLGSLFLSTEGNPCDDAADANDDGSLDIADPGYLLQFLFLGGPPPAQPYPEPGFDPTPDGLFCETQFLAQITQGGQVPFPPLPNSWIHSYAVKFVCLEALQPGQISFDPVVPLVEESTEVLIHNPNLFPVLFYKKAVRAGLESRQPIPPGKWCAEALDIDYAIRLDCDEITKLLTGNVNATFLGTFGIGNKVEGFVVIGAGPQTPRRIDRSRPPLLDVTADYNKGSEVLKKSIDYQPWWWWWWWRLPWRLGYAHQRVIPAPQDGKNIDCRELLYEALATDVVPDPQAGVGPLEVQQALMALERGRMIDPTNAAEQDLGGTHALVAMIGKCDKLVIRDQLAISIDYVLFSTDGPTDQDPRGVQAKPVCGNGICEEGENIQNCDQDCRPILAVCGNGLCEPGENPATCPQDCRLVAGGQVTLARYPWLPGRWYDLVAVIPQNRSLDVDRFIRDWLTNEWVRVAGVTQQAVILRAMKYFFPWWCGWGYWWWWWWGEDCIDIGVGEGESIDVEDITPKRLFMEKWPLTDLLCPQLPG